MRLLENHILLPELLTAFVGPFDNVDGSAKGDNSSYCGSSFVLIACSTTIDSPSLDSLLQRLIKDFKALQNDPPLGVNASPHPDNIMQWNAIIFGPEGTVWEDGIFRLTLEFSEDYPQKAPSVKFVSTLFHPNGTRFMLRMEPHAEWHLTNKYILWPTLTSIFFDRLGLSISFGTIVERSASVKRNNKKT